MATTTYEVVTSTVTVAADSNGQPQSFTLTAPTGKQPLAGGIRDQMGHGSDRVTLLNSYPSSDTWVFGIVGGSFSHSVDLYLTTAAAI